MTPIATTISAAPFSPALFENGRIVLNGQPVELPAGPSVRQIVAENPRLARIFEKYGLSYCCCGGNKSLVEACAERGVSLETIVADLRAASAAPEDQPEDTDWHDAPMTDHVRHLVGTHHAYLHAELPRLSFLIDRVTSRHGEIYPELWELEAAFEEFRGVLDEHLDREERCVFPLILRLEEGRVPAGAPAADHLLGQMRREHVMLTDALARIHCITGGFRAPETACNTYRVLMDSLQEMSTQLCLSIEEETTILYPRVMELAGRQTH